MSKIPAPPDPDKVDLYMPIAFWSEYVTYMDRRIEFMCERHRFGTIEVKYVIQDGKISQTVYGEEVRIKGTYQKSEAVAVENKI